MVNGQSPNVSTVMLGSIAELLKLESSLSDINRLFRLADVEPDWYVDLGELTSSQRYDRAMGWFEGIRANAPDELLRVAISVTEQIASKTDFLDLHSKDKAERILIRLNEVALAQAEEDGVSFQTTDGDTGRPTIFVGHGLHPAWGQFVWHVERNWNVDIVVFESENRTAEENDRVVESMTAASSVAIVLMTGDDQTADGKRRARQNVIHEAGICHGKLGFGRVALLVEEGVERFSNIDGIQYISYNPNRVTDCLYQVGGFLKKHGIKREET